MVIMTEKELVKKLETLVNRRTFYKNKYPYNLGLVAPPKSTKEFVDCRKNKRVNYNPFEAKAQSFDCSNLVKALLNGYDIDKMEVGYYQVVLSNTGDCSEYKLLSQCTDISSDFSKLGNQARLLYTNSPNGHIGVYLGKTVQDKYNVVECTCAKAIGNGVKYSWVDSDGTRRAQKGGAAICKWQKHGLMAPWISYKEVSEKKPDYSKYPILKKGNKGEYVKILQTKLVEKGYDPKGVDGIFGPGCDAAVRKFQRDKKLVVDGCVGPKTWGALYK